jgi:hypothetical protein
VHLAPVGGVFLGGFGAGAQHPGKRCFGVKHLALEDNSINAVASPDQV